jgi:ubiquinone/menaquinone biosynthesis C-methylase UbiE
MMLPRTLEAELMDSDDEATEYDSINHHQVNAAFADDFLNLPDLKNDCLDLGTGTALIPIEICRRRESLRFMACDAAIAMLEMARFNIDVAGMLDRVQLQQSDAKRLPFQDEFFDAVISNSLVHHLPDPKPMLAEAWRVLKTGGWLFVRDLFRPASHAAVEDLVQQHAANESAASQQLLRQSLHAALTMDEVRDLLNEAGMPSGQLKQTSDRHWTLSLRK